MKQLYILYLIAFLSSTALTAQDFSWENATYATFQGNNQGLIIEDAGGIRASFRSATGSTVILGPLGAGTSGNSVTIQTGSEQAILGFSPQTDVYSIFVYNANPATGVTSEDFEFVPLGSTQGTPVTVSVGNTVQEVVLDWTNVFQIGINRISTTGTSAIGIDDIFLTDPCTVNIPDLSFRNTVLNDTAINTNGDNFIQCDEASNFTGQLILTNQNINTLQGIEAFSNVTEIYCGDNNLTSIDVSQNPSLEILNCANNQLSSINTSQNGNLVQLTIINNSVTSLDLSNNTALEQLDANNNNLTRIDLSQNPNMITLSCRFNDDLNQLNLANGRNGMLTQSGNGIAISFMDARNNANLSCINVDPGFDPTNLSSNYNWSKPANATYSSTCTLSIDSEAALKATVFPNPTSSWIEVDCGQHAFAKAEIFNLQGKLVLESILKSIDLSQLHTGLYLLKIETIDGLV